MCGIFAYIGDRKNAGEIILSGLKALEYRGYDSWGIATKTDANQITVIKRVGKIGNATIKNEESSIGIGHTRWATHGGVKEINSHPHTSCNNEIIVVHNGIVDNHEQLRKELTLKGHKFISETDTEVLAHFLEEEYKKNNDPIESMHLLKQTISGLNAIIVFFTKENIFLIYKNGSPIVVGKQKNELFVASDPVALAPHTKNMYFVEDNEMLTLDKDGIFLINSKNQKNAIKFKKINYSINEGSKSGFDHFMIKEINEQYEIIVNILTNEINSIEEIAKKIKESFGTYLVGCGTASYAAIAGVYFFSKIARRHLNSTFGSEFSYLLDFIRRKTLVIALSQSGETIDTISSVKKAKEKGAELIAIVNQANSTLDRLSDKSLYLHAGPEKAVASTKAYTAKITYLFLLSHAVASTLTQGIKDIEDAAQEVKRVISDSDLIKKLAQKLISNKHIFILGRGISYACALESALKIKEVSYIHAEGIAAGELKHGVIALIEKGTPVIVYNPKDETYDDTLSAAYEVKARGAMVIGVSENPSDAYDIHIPVKFCGNATIIPQVVVAQLLGYYLAVLRDLDPDMPRNLAKSVTVK
jgi:glucosamine--fructose-6-phosphate aminotransferase (isomerizing)